MQHPFQVNDILVAEWGATMRMVDFYKVIHATRRAVILMRIAQKDDVSTGFMKGTVMPDPDKPEAMPPLNRHDPTFLRYPKRASSGDWFIKGHNGSCIAVKWNGAPVEYDHCD